MTDSFNLYKAYAEKLLRNPNDVDALNDLFTLINNSGHRPNIKNYVCLMRRAAAVEPDNLGIMYTFAVSLEKSGQYAEAVAVYERLLNLLPDCPLVHEVLHDLGVCYRGLGDNAKAIEYYDRAIALDPKPIVKRNRAIAMLVGATHGTHSFVEALKAFECRRECAEEKFKETGVAVEQMRLPDGVVHWEGQPLEGKSIAVFHEAGFGDFIQFSRFIPGLRKEGTKIYVTGANLAILELVASNLPLDGVIPLEASAECDYVLASMSVPWRLGIEYKDISGTPYFKAEPAKLPRRGELNVGLVWRGNPAYNRDYIRSSSLETFTPLFDIPEAAFYSLQVGTASTEITNLGLDGFVADLQPFMKTWRDTARAIQALDVVVTVDTAVAHLAGALGKPVFIMTHGADWRWHRNSDRTVWYDSARTIRQQTQGEWGPCVEEIKERLKEMIIAGRRQAA